MKKLLNKFSIILMILVISLGALSMPVEAKESASVSISTKTVTAGDEVSITVKASSSNAIVMCDLWLNYDPNVLEAVSGYNYGGGGSIRILSTDTTSFTVTFKTLNVGSSSISLNTGTSIISSEAEDYMTISAGTGKVTVNAATSYSTNNNLKSLSISPGTLTPAFSPNITSYTASVDSDCQALVVSAIAEDANAKVSSPTGTKMDTGTNTTKITVTAQNGSTKVYIITTTKAEAAVVAIPTVSTIIDGVNYNIISDFTKHPLPSGYEATSFDFNGQSITVGKSSNNLIIMYLEKADGSGEGAFYIYDTTSEKFSLLCTVAEPELTYTILPITSSMELPDGFTKSTFAINENNVDVLIPSSSNIKYCLFYGVDSTGKSGWYRYDYAEKTVQKYYGDDLVTEAIAPVLQQSDNTKMWKIVAASSAFASLIFLVAVVILAVKFKSKKTKSYYEENDNEEEEDIFSIITQKELAGKESPDNNELINYNSVGAQIDNLKLDNDETENKENYNSEIATEIAAELGTKNGVGLGAENGAKLGTDPVATQKIDSKEDDFELDAEELLENDEFGSYTSELSENDEEDNDISEMKDILEDEDENDSVDDENNSNEDDNEDDGEDDDDFEFLDIEDLEDK